MGSDISKYIHMLWFIFNIFSSIINAYQHIIKMNTYALHVTRIVKTDERWINIGRRRGLLHCPIFLLYIKYNRVIKSLSKVIYQKFSRIFWENVSIRSMAVKIGLSFHNRTNVRIWIAVIFLYFIFSFKSLSLDNNYEKTSDRTE